MKRPEGPRFLAGGGELGALMRGFDWSASPLGPPDDWPQALKTAVSIMLTSRQPIWIGWGKDLIYLYNNPYKSIIGGKHPWALGRPTSEVWREIWPDIGPMLETAMGGVEGTYVEEQLLIMERNGYPEETYYTFSYSPIPDDDGTPGGIICANTDDTQRVIGERQLGLLRDLAAGAADARTWQQVCEKSAQTLSTNLRDMPLAAIYMLNEDGSGYDLAGLSGIDPGHVAVPPSVSLESRSPWPLAEVLERQELMLIENLGSRFDQPLPAGEWSQPPANAALLPIYPTGETGRSGVLVVGLNPFRLFDESYRSFLELAAGQIAAAIAAADAYEEAQRRAHALAELDRAKTVFFSNVSHEFRTPLTLMLSPLEDALAKADEVPQSMQTLLSVAHRNGLRLLKLVNTLLDFSRIEAGKTQARFVPTDIAGFTAELASNFRSATDKAGLKLRVDCKPTPEAVYLDRDSWEKIVLNLLSNAFKFTFEGEITVGLESVGRNAELTVRDTGTGIPESELPKLFDRFHRIEGARGRSFEGSGIGLALVQELVKLHGGTIRVESTEGDGTTFTVSIPFGTAHLPKDKLGEGNGTVTTNRAYAFVEEALRWLPGSDDPLEFDRAFTDLSSTDAATDSARGTIVLADDNADMRSYVRNLLGSQHEVKTVADGREALEELRRHKPDILLTDIMMPVMDGFELIRKVREDPELRDLPILALSARAGEEASVEGISAGADDYLVKPFAARELVARVNRALDLARMRRRLNQSVRESEARFRAMADNAPVMVWTTDPTGYCTFLSRSWYQFTGQTPETGLGFGWLEATHPDDRARSRQIFLEANKLREPFSLEYRLLRSDGEYRWAIDAAAPWFDEEGEFLGYIGSVIDITARKEVERAHLEMNRELELRVEEEIAQRAVAEEQLRQAQKMEAIGHLTGGVAHDFNNLLTIVVGNLESLHRHFPEETPDRLRRFVQNAMEGAKRATTLTQRLLAFSRRQPLEPKPIELNRVVSAMSELLHRTIGESIEIQTILSGGLWRVEIDPAQIESSLLNLCVNARDAMPNGGKLTIETANAHLDELYAAKEAEVVPGQYVMLAVTDTGTGMSKEILSRVFEPFFTTKPTGHGTGLGLSQVYGFVKQSGGHVKIYSEEGEGTTVKIYIPRYLGAGAEDEAPLVSIPDGHMGETILVVEDDDGVREYSSEILRELGYRVIEAQDGPSALKLLDQEISVDLLFTDVGLGQMNGRELADAARKKRPNLKVLYTTGYARNAIVHHGRLDAGVHMIGKPFAFADLAAKVRAVLEEQD